MYTYILYIYTMWIVLFWCIVLGCIRLFRHLDTFSRFSIHVGDLKVQLLLDQSLSAWYGELTVVSSFPPPFFPNMGGKESPCYGEWSQTNSLSAACHWNLWHLQRGPSVSQPAGYLGFQCEDKKTLEDERDSLSKDLSIKVPCQVNRRHSRTIFCCVLLAIGQPPRQRSLAYRHRPIKPV